MPKKDGFYIIVGIPTESQDLKHEWVLGDSCKAHLESQLRFITRYADLRILPLKDNTVGSIHDALQELNK